MIDEIKAQNPFKLPDEWSEENPWDILHCLKCNQAWKVPSKVYEVWVELNYGCPSCLLEENL